MEQLHPMLSWIRDQLGPCEKGTCHKIELASEEAIVNIIRYSYKNRSGTIEIEVKVDPQRIEIILKDQGPPFNPLERKLPQDLETPLEEREEGGLGIFFIRKCMDEVRYHRHHNTNNLTLIKRI